MRYTLLTQLISSYLFSPSAFPAAWAHSSDEQHRSDVSRSAVWLPPVHGATAVRRYWSCVGSLRSCCSSSIETVRDSGNGFESAGRPRVAKLRYCAQTLRPCGTPKGPHPITKQASLHAFLFDCEWNDVCTVGRQVCLFFLNKTAKSH